MTDPFMILPVAEGKDNFVYLYFSTVEFVAGIGQDLKK
jgi:hypothetical protein